MARMLSCGWIQRATNPAPLEIEEHRMAQMKQATEWILTKTKGPEVGQDSEAPRMYRGNAKLDKQIIH